MAEFVVEGPSKLSGTIRPSGNKNEALPVIAASLLSSQPIILSNLPNIGDVASMLSLAESLGARLKRDSVHKATLTSANLSNSAPSTELARSIRGSILFAGPLLVRLGETFIPFPGGDKIGRRRIDTHLLGFEALGAEVKVENTGVRLVAPKGLSGTDILLDEASVTATENLLMAASLANGVTILRNAASEPHVQQLGKFLNACGAKIDGIGSNVLRIEGVDALHGAEHRIGPDYLEVGSFIGLAAVTGSELRIEDAAPEHLRIVLHQFHRMGIDVEHDGDAIWVPSDQKLETLPDVGSPTIKIDDAPWPGFPADLTSIAVVVATQVKGTVMVFEKMFESRLFFTDRLIGMGANIILCDPHRALIVGPNRLHGSQMSSPDIRAGMALLIAALCAEGQSVIQNIEQIDRGYEKLDERLSILGASIERVDD